MPFRRPFAVLAATLAFGATLPAAAEDVTIRQDAAVGDGAARYAMRATAEGTLRLDTRTGETTLCTTAGGRLKCSVSAEERAAYQQEIDALGTRLEKLEQRLIALEGPGRGSGEMSGSADALSEAQRRNVDQAVSMAERAMRGFVGVVKRLKRDYGEPGAPSGAE